MAHAVRRSTFARPCRSSSTTEHRGAPRSRLGCSGGPEAMAKRTPPVNSRKQPLGVEPERTRRATRGRTTAVETPVEIRAPGMQLSAALEPYVHEKLGAKLGAFALQIERVSVRFRDLNGPRGGEDTECRIQVVLSGRPDVVAHARAAEPRHAFDEANRSVGKAV